MEEAMAGELWEQTRARLEAELERRATMSKYNGMDADIRAALGRVTDQASEIVSLRLACNVVSADLQTIGKLCGMRDDEYPLKAVERLRQRVEELDRLADMAGDWIETDPSLRSTACIEAALDHAKELDAEVVSLRQRVEEVGALRQRVERENALAVKRGAMVDSLRQRVEELEQTTGDLCDSCAALENPSPGGPALTGGTPDGVTGVSPESPVCFHCGYRRENVLAPEVKP